MIIGLLWELERMIIGIQHSDRQPNSYSRKVEAVVMKMLKMRHEHFYN